MTSTMTAFVRLQADQVVKQHAEDAKQAGDAWAEWARHVQSVETTMAAFTRQQADERVKGFADEAKQHQQDIDELAGRFDFVNSAISRSVSAVIAGTKTLDQAFADLGQSILLSFTEKIINEGLNTLAKEFARFTVETIAQSQALRAALGLTQAGTTALTGTGALGLGADYYAAGGGLYMQEGGVTTREVTAHLHPREAVIPLDHYDWGRMGGKVEVRIIHQAGPDVEVVPGQRQSVDGREIQEIIIRTVERGIGGGRFDRSMGSRFGSSPRV